MKLGTNKGFFSKALLILLNSNLLTFLALVSLLFRYYFVIVSLLFRYYFLIISLLFSYYFVIISLLFCYYFIIVSLLFHYCFVIISLLFHYYFVMISLLFRYYFVIIGPRLKTDGTYKVTLVCAAVRACGTDYLRNLPKDFSKIWHEVRDQ